MSLPLTAVAVPRGLVIVVVECFSSLVLVPLQVALHALYVLGIAAASANTLVAFVLEMAVQGGILMDRSLKA